MLHPKQRAYLKKKAHHLDPVLHIGKSGLSQSFLNELDQALEKHELIKLRLLDNSPFDFAEQMEDLLRESRSEFVSRVGKTLVLYRKSFSLKPEERLLLPPVKK
ncbi:MAG: ribosome assembly RNA-binding protein YhbY [Tissierellia bacterium]|jgi:RNA-binding protein|nr:ribosome assembly RNA-binding protein YhbY [Bacillota bacterium]NLL22688.1 ribosome assembly RNA-binding protein YhbY [Tissierellia bacterium]